MDKVYVKTVKDCVEAMANNIRLGWLCVADQEACLAAAKEATSINECQRIADVYSQRLRFIVV